VIRNGEVEGTVNPDARDVDLVEFVNSHVTSPIYGTTTTAERGNANLRPTSSTTLIWHV
jgi:hypothetical protein